MVFKKVSFVPRLYFQAMRQLVLASARVDSRLRNVTLELACLVLRHFVLALDCNQVTVDS